MRASARSLALMRERGYIAAVVERWNPHVEIRQDLFGVADVIAISEGDVVLVQATTRRQIREHAEKIRAAVTRFGQDEFLTLPLITRGPVRMVIHGWWKQRNRWQVREVELK